jgi:imidazole glycerol-phosphate synthase subunit HisF
LNEEAIALEFVYFCWIETSMNPKRILPSIYTSDGQFAQTENRQHVLDYNEAMERALAYEADGADELIVMDVTTLTERRRNLPKFLKDVTNTLKIPIIFGGGIHTDKDVEEMLKLGLKKIYVNSAAVRNPALINKITQKYGSESLLVAIDTRKTFGSWKVYLNGGKSRTEIDLLNWVEMVQVRGAGEILVSTIARNTILHADVLEVLNNIREIVKVPLLASIGANSIHDFSDIFLNTNVDGIVSGHYFMQDETSISALKQGLLNEGIPIQLSKLDNQTSNQIENDSIDKETTED